MKIFLSWSGPRSKHVASIFREWLPSVLQAIVPYFTPTDIEKGTRWSTEISGELDSCSVGLVFLTKENRHADWIMFESGALSKKLEKTRLCPVLLDFEPSDLEAPLNQFQVTPFNKEEVKKLIEVLNSDFGDRALGPPVLDKIFQRAWPELEADVAKALSEDVPAGPDETRTDSDVLKEVLALTRRLATERPSFSSAFSNSSRASKLAVYDLARGIEGIVEQQFDSPAEAAEDANMKRLFQALRYLGRNVLSKDEQEKYPIAFLYPVRRYLVPVDVESADVTEN